MNEDVKYMREALELAKKGMYTAAPNPCVGCVLVRDGEILGCGYHVRAGLPHAEVCAMRDAKEKGYNIAGVTAYVTLEPCSHYGLTPPCAKALAEAKVGRVVCACTDPNPLVSGRGIRILEESGIPVTTGVLEGEALELNRRFFYAMKENRPYVTLKLGMSLDAKTALATGESKWITSTESRQDVQRLRALNQAIMTSADTVLADNPSLTLRYDDFSDELKQNYPLDLVKQPLRVIVDTARKITNYELNIFKVEGKVLLVRASSDDAWHEEVISENITEVQIPVLKDEPTHVDFSVLFAYLHSQKIRGVLVEAGGRFTASLLSQGVINELVTYIAPSILGTQARGAFAQSSPEKLADVAKMQLFDTQKIGNDVRLTYRF